MADEHTPLPSSAPTEKNLDRTADAPTLEPVNPEKKPINPEPSASAEPKASIAEPAPVEIVSGVSVVRKSDTHDRVLAEKVTEPESAETQKVCKNFFFLVTLSAKSTRKAKISCN